MKVLTSLAASKTLRNHISNEKVTGDLNVEKISQWVKTEKEKGMIM